MRAFNSPVLLENIKQLPKELHGQILRHFQNAPYALAYYLETILPKGGTVGVLYPKAILKALLPEIADRKKCKLVYENSDEIDKADIYITEPEGFGKNGAYVKPSETELVAKYKPIAIGSIYQYTDITPAYCDCAEITKTITEIGIYAPEKLSESLPLLNEDL